MKKEKSWGKESAKGAKSEQKWRKSEDLGSKPTKLGKKAAKRGENQNCAILKPSLSAFLHTHSLSSLVPINMKPWALIPHTWSKH